MTHFIFHKLFPPGQDEYLYIEPKLDCGFPLNCRKYNRYTVCFLCGRLVVVVFCDFIQKSTVSVNVLNFETPKSPDTPNGIGVELFNFQERRWVARIP